MNFKVVALLDAINAAETARTRRLSTWHMRGRTRRPDEWLAANERELVRTLARQKASGAWHEGRSTARFECPIFTPRCMQILPAARILRRPLGFMTTEYLPDEVRARVMDAMRNGTGRVELRTRVESSEAELVLVPVDGTEALWLTRTSS